MYGSRKPIILARFSLALILMAATPPVHAVGGWDKCPQSATVTLDQRSVTKDTGLRRSVLRHLAPAVLVTGQIYDFSVVCPFEGAEDTAASPTRVAFYQEDVSIAKPQGPIILRPISAAQGPDRMTGRTGQTVSISFPEKALGGTHEQKFVASVSIKGEQAFVTFVLISSSYYRKEIAALGQRRHP